MAGNWFISMDPRETYALSFLMLRLSDTLPMVGVAGSGKSIIWCVDQLLLSYRETYVTEKFRNYQEYCTPA